MDKILTLRVLLTGDALRKLYRRRRTNRHKVSLATGISYMTLLNWEKNLTVPSDHKLVILARHFDLADPAGDLKEGRTK